MKTNTPHDSAHTHVTGASEYVDDRPMLPGELFVGCYYSKVAHAKITRVSTKKAMAIPGVRAVVTADDVSHNAWGPIFQDQPIIAADVVRFAGEVIAVVGATSMEALRQGLAAIECDLAPLPRIMTIRQAIDARSFIGDERFIRRGNAGEAIQKSAHKLKGTLRIKGADHFYLENQSCVAYPREAGQMEVHSSTQHPTETQHVVAEALGVAFADVVCVVKRLGGGFGGKESQSSPIAAYAALVARKTNTPARLVLTKDDDMIMTGKRNPFEIDYEVGFNEDGMILGLRSKLYSDGGAYADLSTAIMERAMLHSDNAYFIPDVEIIGQVCKTNIHPHTAFRGFGGPKGVAVIESVIEDIARHLRIDPLDVRQRNVYRSRYDVTPYGQKVENNQLPALFGRLEETCDYRARRAKISLWNASRDAKGKHMLRGLSMTAVKFGISFTTRFLNQGNALVQLHRDGSAQISTGAVEMGQGVNTRIAMLASECLGITLPKIRVMTTSTEKNANTSPTAASTGTDINGAATLNACGKIRKRLAAAAVLLQRTERERWPSRSAGLGTAGELDITTVTDAETDSVIFANDTVSCGSFSITMKDLVNECYLSRVSLGEYGYHKTANLGFNKLSGQGYAFHYFTQGVACSEVELNQLTGEVKVRRVDILMDLGRPIHEDLDKGQITGAFIQGMGWVTTENLVYNSEGLLLSHAPSTYKIPSIQDTPRVFNVDLIPNEGNTVNIRGTKAVGEPPLLLAISVWTAIKNAIHYKASSGTKAHELTQSLDIPATAEANLRQLHPEAFARYEDSRAGLPRG